MRELRAKYAARFDVPDGGRYVNDWASRIDDVLKRLDALEECISDYADPDTWNAVKSPESTSAWEKVGGHPCPWVDARHALEQV